MIKSLFHKSEDLKKSLQGRQNKETIFKDPKYHEFVEIHKKLLLQDLDFAIDKKSEVELWTVAFKEVINFYQSEITSRSSILDKNKKSEAQTALTWFLDFASGFYILLLQDICVSYDLDLPFLRSVAFYGVSSEAKSAKKCQNVANVNYICTHCLVHLGDISRYRGHLKQAENFYRNSLKIAPTCGHSYNQLALLQVSKGCQLTCVFYYVRALALKCPFPAAAANLSKMYGKIITNGSEDDFVSKFLLFQAFLHSAVRLKKAVELLEKLCEDLIASEMKTKDMIKCISICLFHLNNFQQDENQAFEEKMILRLQVQLLAGFLSAFLLPIYTIKQENLLDFNGLPIIKLILDFVILNPKILSHPGFMTKQQIWPGLAKLLNDLKKQKSSTEENHENFPLPEEFDLQSFQPLNERLKSYNFKQILKGCSVDVKTIKMLRGSRILAQGKILSDSSWRGQKVLVFEGDQFKAIENDVSASLIESFEKDLKFISEDFAEAEKTEENLPIVKKKTKNVAMEAIMKQSFVENKTVTFKTPSPNFSEDSNSTNISQEEYREKPAYLTKANISTQLNQTVLPMDFSVPPPPLPFQRPPPTASNWPRNIDPISINATLRAPSYQLFGGQGPAWCLPNQTNLQRPPPPSNTRPPHNFLFQPGPSALEKLLQQNPRQFPKE